MWPGEDSKEGKGETEFLNDLFAWVIDVAAEQASDDVEPLVSFVKTCAILFSVQHYIQITKLQINPLWSMVWWAVSLGLSLSGKWEGKEQDIILLFICILVPKCKYNFLCYFFVVTTKMNILIR